ncbi:MAG: hypothetical protein AB8G05_18060 [Oligoflexales bacterium]
MPKSENLASPSSSKPFVEKLVLRGSLASVWVMGCFASCPLSGAQIVTCSRNKLAASHHCVLEATHDEKMEIGGTVVTYRKGSYWAGTGTIISSRGEYAIAEFKDYIGILHKGMTAYIYRENELGISDWRHTFSKSEALPYR